MTDTVHDTLSINISSPTISVAGGVYEGVVLGMPHTIAAGELDRSMVTMQLSKIEEIVEYLKALYR